MIRFYLRHITLSFLGNFSTPSNRTHFLNGHYVVPTDAAPTEKSVEEQKNLFYEQLVSLSKVCTLVNPDEAIENRYQQSNPMVCLTFDDGFEDVSSVIIPVLDKLKLKAIFFVNPSFLGLDLESSQIVLQQYYHTPVRKKFLTKQQVTAISESGHTIGSHTSHHIRLNTDDINVLEREIVGSKAEIAEITNMECKYFAYPFGGKLDISDTALEMATKHYDHVFSSIRNEGLFSLKGRVINRRHFEGNWPANHLRFFLAEKMRLF